MFFMIKNDLERNCHYYMSWSHYTKIVIGQFFEFYNNAEELSKCQLPVLQFEI